MFVKSFIKASLEDPNYRRIQYDTLYTLHILPSIADGAVRLQQAFSLTSGPRPEVTQLSINPPFRECFMNQGDEILLWRDLPTYEKKRPNSIIDLSKNILKDKYLGPLGFSSYRDKVSAIGFGTYYEILNLIVGSLNADAERKLLSDAEKKQSLRILEFFNGVPEPLVNYYDEEGEFLADWLQSNCL